GLSVTSRIPSQSQSRRQVVGVGRDQTSTNARVSWKNHAQRRARHHFGLLARKKSVGPVVSGVVRTENLVSKSNVQHQARRKPIVILNEAIPIPALHQP